MNGIIIIFFRQKKQDASVSLIGNTRERRRRKKRQEGDDADKEKRGTVLIIVIYAFITRERNVSFGPKIRDEFYEKMRLVYVHARYVFFFLFFHALSLLQLLTMFQR